MATSVVKKARFPLADAKVLESLARREAKTESEILREAIRLYDHQKRRMAAVEEFIARTINGPPPKKIRYPLKSNARRP
ncbi:MAG: ribbon-helix-helix protein, CopG family [Thermoplasmatota archaeon]